MELIQVKQVPFKCYNTFKPASDKHFSLLHKFLNYGIKYFITFSPASPDHSGSAWPADPASMQGRLEQMEAVSMVKSSVIRAKDVEPE